MGNKIKIAVFGAALLIAALILSAGFDRAARGAEVEVIPAVQVCQPYGSISEIEKISGTIVGLERIVVDTASLPALVKTVNEVVNTPLVLEPTTKAVFFYFVKDPAGDEMVFIAEVDEASCIVYQTQGPSPVARQVLEKLKGKGI